MSPGAMKGSFLALSERGGPLILGTCGHAQNRAS